MKKILITGAAGNIGSILVDGLKHKYEIRGLDCKPMPEIKDSIVASLSDKEALVEAAKGVDAIIHLAAIASGNAPWEVVLESNIIGTYNMFEAARICNVKRFIYTSTCQVTFGYGELAAVTWDMPPRPVNYYGVSKVTGEMLGYMYSEKFGMEVICVRIGKLSKDEISYKVMAKEKNLKGRYLSPRDAVQLYDKALTKPGIKYEVVYAASKSSKACYDIEHTKEVLGYEPLDSEDEALEVAMKMYHEKSWNK